MFLLLGLAHAEPLRETPLLTAVGAYENFGHDVAGLGDVDGDGFDDVGVAAGEEDGATLYYRGGPVGFSPAEALGGVSEEGPTWVVQGVGDLDDDGFDDVYAQWQDCPGADYLDACAFWGARSGLDGGSHVGWVSLSSNDRLYPSGDFDGDGLLDVVKGKGALDGSWPVPDQAYACTLYLGSGEIWHRTAYSDDNDALCWSASLQGDTNGDGYGDLVAGAPGDYGSTSRVRVFYGGLEPDEFDDTRIEAEFSENYLGWSVAVADVDGDGFADVAAGMPADAPEVAGEVFVLAGGASGIDEVRAFSGPLGFGASVALADLDADGDPDLAVGTPGESQFVTVYTNEAGGFGGSTQVIDAPSGSASFGWWVEDAGDVNGDGAHDLLVADPADGRVYVYAGDGPDADGDGAGDPVDCGPDDRDVLPGADEHCDGADEDCDGDIDEDAIDAPTWYLDADGDGYGGEETAVACEAPRGHVAAGGDCDDDDDAIHPDATDILDDDVDQDCNGYDSRSVGTEPTPTLERPEEEGCGCAAAPDASAGWLAALLALALARGRRNDRRLRGFGATRRSAPVSA